MCGIAGFVAIGSAATPTRAPARSAMRDVITHRGPDEAGLHCDGQAGARPPPAEHRRSRRRPAAAVERGRVDLGRLQRRDLQPRRRPARARSARPRYRTHSRHRDDRPRLRRVGRRLRRSLPRHVRVRDLGRAAAAPAARARSARHQAALLGARRRSRCSSGRRSRRSSQRSGRRRSRTTAALPELLEHALSRPARRRCSAASTSCCRATCWCSRTAWTTIRQYWDVPVGEAGARRVGAAARDADASSQFRELLEESVRLAADERRAARHVPLRRHRQQRDRGADGADDRPAARRRSRSRSRSGRSTSWSTRGRWRARSANPHEIVIDDTRLLRRAAEAGLARGRADRASVERAAVLRLGARAPSTSRSC